MSFIPFPNVPFPITGVLSGIPPVPRSPNFPPTLGLVLSTIQGALWRAFQVNDKWGIFNKAGTRLGDVTFFTPNINEIFPLSDFVGALGGSTLSTVSLSYGKDTRIADFPVEKGSFASYNKIELPAEPVVAMSVTGTDADRTKFLADIDKACKSVDLYSVVTPDATYINYSVERYNYERTAQNGAYLLTVQIFLKEIRQVQAIFTQIKDSKSPTAVSQQNGGQVQPKAPAGNTNLSKLTPR